MFFISVVSYKLATMAYKQELYDEAYNITARCENEDHKSKGCDLVAMIVLEGKTIETNNMDYDKGDSYGLRFNRSRKGRY